LDGGYFDVARAVVDYLRLEETTFSLQWACDVPFGSGLSSSSAMMVAILNAVLAFCGRKEHVFFRAEMARHIELHYLVLCGYQDAYMCTFGGLNYMDFRQKQFYRTFGDEPYATVEPLADHVADLSDSPFVLAHTGVRRSSGTVHRPIRERWLDGDPEVVRCYMRIAHLARLGKRSMLAGDWEQLGQAMNENHEIQRELGGSGPENERLIEAARSGGAFGAKLAGAGHGGTIIALVDSETRAEVINSLNAAGASRIMTVTPGPGVTVTPIRTEQDRKAAMDELIARAGDQDLGI